jgi:hypothetical protein
MTAYEYEAELFHELAAHEGEGEYEAVPAAAAAAARAALEAVAGESEGEGEAELNPVRRWYADAMLEHLAHEAAQAESEAEAGEAFLPLIPLVASKLLPLAARAAVPLVRRAMPQVMKAVSRVTPQLTRGVVNVARTMYRSPATRRLLRAVPTIAQRTVGQIARQVANGQPVTAQGAVRTLAKQTLTVLRHPARYRRAVRRSRALDTRFHRVIPGVRAPGGSRAAGPASVPGPGAPSGVVTGRGCRCCGCRCGGCGCR